MKYLLVPLILLSLVPMAYAQEFDPVGDFDIAKFLSDGVDYLSGIGMGAVDNSDISQDTKDRVDSAIEGGVPVAKKSIDFYISLHHYIVDMIFSNSPVDVGVGIASIVSLGLIGFMLYHFLRKMFKWIVIAGLVIVGIFMFLIVFGIEISI